MNKALKKRLEKMLKNGDCFEVEKILSEQLITTPDDWEAKLLYGTCKMMQGDVETAKQIHDEAEKHYNSAKNIPAKEKTFWQKYHNWIIYGVMGTSLVILGICGIKEIYNKLKVQIVEPIDAKIVTDINPARFTTKYGGPIQTYYCSKPNCSGFVNYGGGWGMERKTECPKCGSPISGLAGW